MPLQTVGGSLLRIPGGGSLARECCCGGYVTTYLVTISGSAYAESPEPWNGPHTCTDVGGGLYLEGTLIRVELYFDATEGRWVIHLWRIVPGIPILEAWLKSATASNPATAIAADYAYWMGDAEAAAATAVVTLP